MVPLYFIAVDIDGGATFVDTFQCYPVHRELSVRYLSDRVNRYWLHLKWDSMYDLPFDVWLARLTPPVCIVGGYSGPDQSVDRERCKRGDLNHRDLTIEVAEVRFLSSVTVNRVSDPGAVIHQQLNKVVRDRREIEVGLGPSDLNIGTIERDSDHRWLIGNVGESLTNSV